MVSWSVSNPGRRSICSCVSISRCMFLKIQMEVVLGFLVIIASLLAASPLENLRDGINAENADEFLHIVPIAVVEHRLDNSVVAQVSRILHIPHELLPCGDKILDSFPVHISSIPKISAKIKPFSSSPPIHYPLFAINYPLFSHPPGEKFAVPRRKVRRRGEIPRDNSDIPTRIGTRRRDILR